MAPGVGCSRINLDELRSQICKRLGPERARKYFGLLEKLLGLKVSKDEFNRFCLSSFGRDFLPLHNQLVRSILQNAYNAKVPPPGMVEGESGGGRSVGCVGKRPRLGENGFIPFPEAGQIPAVRANGVVPPSPRKSRLNVRDRRMKDRPSPLGPNGGSDAVPDRSLALSGETAVRENGFLSPCDLKRPLEWRENGPADQPAKRQRTEGLSADDHVAVRNCLLEVATVEDREELAPKNTFDSSRQPILAPLGIPFCHASVGGAHRSSTFASRSIGSFSGCSDTGELCDTGDLKNRMERIAEAQGLGGVSMDSANLLNHGVDAYLKRLISACVQHVGARSGQQSTQQQAVYKQQPHGNPVNGLLPGSHLHVQSSSRPLDGAHELTRRQAVSLHDFRVAMELNPKQLGEDWPLQLEKICIRSFQE